MHPTASELGEAYRGRRVFVTGHTGFKGAWLTMWLRQLGAQVTGYALDPDTTPALFDQLALSADCSDIRADVRDATRLAAAVREANADYVFHLAAQPLVRKSYDEPLQTLSTNVMGTAHLLEAVRQVRRPCAVVVVTSDKCYENDGSGRPMAEGDAMGGHDVYSMSKGATELVVASYRRSFFSPSRMGEHGVSLGSARAGNVIGGGDWARDRILPDAIRALAAGKPVPVRNPAATRPWQHVLEPLGGYLLLGARLLRGSDAVRGSFCEAWNFGPDPEGSRPVREVVTSVLADWGAGTWEDTSDPSAHHEATVLSLAIDKAEKRLNWRPRWDFSETIRRTVAWYRVQHDAPDGKTLRSLSESQITDYMGATG